MVQWTLNALRGVKWRVVVPAAYWLGLPHEKVANGLRLAPLRAWLRGKRGASEGVELAAAPARSESADPEKRYPGPPRHSVCHSSAVAEVCRVLREAGQADVIGAYVDALVARRPEHEPDIRWGQAVAALDKSAEQGLAAAEAVFARFPLMRFRKALYQQYNQLGSISRSLELVREMDRLSGGRSRSAEILEARERMLSRGVVLPAPAEHRAYQPRPQGVLYLLHNSLPHASGGYATRTHGLVCGLRAHGWEVECATRLGYPQDIKQAAGWVAPVDHVDGVPYHRLRDPSRAYRRVDAERYLELNARAVEKLARKRRPAILHGASNHINGIAAVWAGRRLGIPSIFEVRGLWELTRISRQPEFENSELYRMIVKLETQACLEADRVIAITEALKELLVERGVPADKITVVPNGTDTERFSQTLSGGTETRRAWAIPPEAVVFGYVGSMPQYEGLDDLITAVARLREQQSELPVYCLLVGDGDQFDELKSQAMRLGVADRVRFTGRVPHDEVESYYAAMDAMVFPRKPQPVTETVSPMKPFEAMAMGKPIIASNVAALAEIIRDGETGVLFEKGRTESLAAAMARVAQDDPLRREIAGRALAWVRENRDWRQLTREIEGLYQQLTDSSAAAAS
ncbi:glycosyltransferase family 4 protein [Gammaproteobacteria bacterium AB-CW1]|uniref:Glycosyltransferase family 4 protein n=1 Tax=Natronospira elongata TaxID=3110268 RepID=A0AAP6MKG1_9GAMM|nr:glycosyltransferase family 4 protein [Gammaproteobacteria bacterium AB-CW1]